jgi:hypothetical protein
MNPWAQPIDYDVTLTEDGTVVYRGRGGMRELSSLQYRVAPADVRKLAAEFENAAFFDLASLYGGLVDHDCSVTLTMADGRRRHVVRAYSTGNAPGTISRLAGRVGDVARIERFRQKDTAGSDRSRSSVSLDVYANLLDRLTWAWPEALQLQERVKATKVSTREAAGRLAWSAFNGRSGGVGLDEVVQISGLYEVGRAITAFASPGDLVWEARLWRGAGTSDLIWISTKTGEVLSWAPASVTVPSLAPGAPRSSP